MKEKKVVQIYNDCLKLIENQIGNSTTSEVELRNLGKKIFGIRFHGVYPVDRLPKLKRNHFCIINLDKSNQPGSHWVGVYNNKGTYSIYDSFGRKSSKILPSIKEDHHDADYDAEQNIIENNCGQRSLAWLWCVYTLGIKNAMKI